MKRSIVLAVALVCVGALGLSGCGGTGGGSGAQSSSTSGSEPKKSNAAAEYVFPFDKYYDALSMQDEMSDEAVVKENNARDQIVAACMAEEGFDYVPAVVSVSDYESSNDSSGGIDDTTLEYAQEYGYGMVDEPEMDEETQAKIDSVDPNQKYYDSLSESEQNAYDEALMGPKVSEEEIASDDYAYDWTKDGCWGKADHEVSGDEVEGADPYEDPDYAELLEQMNAVDADIYESAEAKELLQQWESCLADAGFSGIDVNNVNAGLYEEYDELTTDAEGNSITPDKADLDAFKAKEIKLAVTDWKCRDSLKLMDKYMRISIDAQQKFVDEHKAELDAMVARYAAAQSS